MSIVTDTDTDTATDTDIATTTFDRTTAVTSSGEAGRYEQAAALRDRAAALVAACLRAQRAESLTSIEELGVIGALRKVRLGG